MKRLLLAAAAAAALSTSAHAATVVFNFGSATGDLGNTETYTQSGLSVTASGFNQFNLAQHLYGKNAGGDEVGLGLTNDPSGEHEIYFGKGYVQLDVSALFGLVVPGSVTFGTNSTTEGETWTVYGSNSAHTLSVNLGSGTSEGSHALPSFGTYRYYDFVSTSWQGGENFLLSNLSLTTAPEPETWALLLTGLFGVGALLRARRAERLAAAA